MELGYEKEPYENASFGFFWLATLLQAELRATNAIPVCFDKYLQKFVDALLNELQPLIPEKGRFVFDET